MGRADRTRRPGRRARTWRRRWLLGGMLVLLIAATPARAANWGWELDNDRYKRLNIFERAQYDKAADMVRRSNFNAAAAEFEKFKIQFPDSPVLPYVIFMRGYCLHRHKLRNEAIRVYNEVLDYFGDRIDDASAALYHLGLAHIENGDIKDGMAAMKEMADDEDYQKHALAAGAIRRLADNHWKNQEQEQAIRYWKQVVRDFHATNDHETRIARGNVLGVYIREQNYSAIDSWMIDEERADEPAHRRWVADAVYDVAWYGFRSDSHGWREYTQFNRDEKRADMNAFYAYFRKQKPWYEQANDVWGYYYRTLQFCSQRTRDDEALETAIEEVSQFIAKLEKEDDRNGKYAWIVDRLREGGQLDRARYCVSKITDPALATYKEYEIVGHSEGRWRDAAEKLIDIAKMGNADWQKRAEDQLAWVYRDRTHEYDKAIQVYLRINRPPDTLWGIQECHRRAGRLQEALNTLSEIENMFPDHAPEAAWRKAELYRDAGDRRNAIAHARRVLKVYPESQAASRAHQMLEDFGVDTGGGVVHEE